MAPHPVKKRPQGKFGRYPMPRPMLPEDITLTADEMLDAESDIRREGISASSRMYANRRSLF